MATQSGMPVTAAHHSTGKKLKNLFKNIDKFLRVPQLLHLVFWLLLWSSLVTSVNQGMQQPAKSNEQHPTPGKLRYMGRLLPSEHGFLQVPQSHVPGKCCAIQLIEELDFVFLRILFVLGRIIRTIGLVLVRCSPLVLIWVW